MEKIAIIAGIGELPYAFYEKAKEHHEVHVIALFNECDPRLKACENFLQVTFTDLPKALGYMVFQQIKKVIMLGKVEKSLIFSDLPKGNNLDAMMHSLKDKKDETIIQEIIGILKLSGIDVMPQNYLLESLMTHEGVYTKAAPSELDMKTIALGRDAAHKLTSLDIGQTVVCKDLSVVAVEGIEGTDNTIKRANEFAGAGTIIVKSARPNQDLRIDVPTIGLNTVKLAKSVQAKGIVFEAERMFFMDQKQSIELANSCGMFILGIK